MTRYCSQWPRGSRCILMGQNPRPGCSSCLHFGLRGGGVGLNLGPNHVWPIPWHFAIDIFCKLELWATGFGLNLRGWSWKKKWSALNLLIILFFFSTGGFTSRSSLWDTDHVFNITPLYQTSDVTNIMRTWRGSGRGWSPRPPVAPPRPWPWLNLDYPDSFTLWL